MGITIKDEAGIQGMRTAGRLASEVLDHLTPLIKPGITTKDIDQFAAHVGKHPVVEAVEILVVAPPAELGARCRRARHSCEIETRSEPRDQPSAGLRGTAARPYDLPKELDDRETSAAHKTRYAFHLGCLLSDPRGASGCREDRSTAVGSLGGDSTQPEARRQ